MNRFVKVLRELDEQLALPQAARSRVLLEVAADLEAAFELAVQGGLSEDEAEAAVVHDFKPTENTLAQLERIHGGPIVRLLDGISAQARDVWERTILAALACLVLLVSGCLLVDLRVFNVAGGWAWVLAVMTSVVLLVAVIKAYELHLRQDHRPRTLRRGLIVMVALALMQVAAGLGLVVVEGYSWLTALISIGPANMADPLSQLARISALATIALLGAIVSALVWFYLGQKVADIEEQEAELLLQIERS